MPREWGTRSVAICGDLEKICLAHFGAHSVAKRLFAEHSENGCELNDVAHLRLLKICVATDDCARGRKAIECIDFGAVAFSVELAIAKASRIQ